MSNDPTTRVYHNIYKANAESIAKASELLRNEEVCAFPTETVYGLGAHAFSVVAIEKIYRLKNRPAKNPLIVHIQSFEMLSDIVEHIPDEAIVLAKAFWPGPLTLVLPKKSVVPQQVSAGQPTVAVRVPAHPVAQQLLKMCQFPLCAPSANRSEHISPTRAEHVALSLPEVSMILDGGPCQFGLESTIIDLSKSTPKLLRFGSISIEKIKFFLPTLEIPNTLVTDENPIAPGMFKKHYAPTARLFLKPMITQSMIDEFQSLGPVGLVRWAPYSSEFQSLKAAQVEILADNPSQYGAELFAALYRLEAAEVKTILVQSPPRLVGWEAVWDRLERAAYHGNDD